MPFQDEAACLVLYAETTPGEWKSKTPPMTETALRGVLLDQTTVGELGEPGLKLRVVSFAQIKWDVEAWYRADNRTFEATQIPIIALTRLLSGHPVPPHLRIDGGDFRLIRPTPA